MAVVGEGGGGGERGRTRRRRRLRAQNEGERGGGCRKGQGGGEQGGGRSTILSPILPILTPHECLLPTCISLSSSSCPTLTIASLPHSFHTQSCGEHACTRGEDATNPGQTFTQVKAVGGGKGWCVCLLVCVCVRCAVVLGAVVGLGCFAVPLEKAGPPFPPPSARLFATCLPLSPLLLLVSVE